MPDDPNTVKTGPGIVEFYLSDVFSVFLLLFRLENQIIMSQRIPHFKGCRQTPIFMMDAGLTIKASDSPSRSSAARSA